MTNVYFFYSVIPVRVTGNNSKINLLILRTFAQLELLFNQEFKSRLPCLTDVYNNGESVNEEKRFSSCELVFELAAEL